MVAHTKLYTATDIINLPENGGTYELHNGVLIEVAGSKYVQTVLAVWIAHLLLNFLEQSQTGGRVTGADGTYILDHYNTRIPDVGYISEENAARQTKGEYINGAPDIAVEVVSDSNTPTELNQRIGAYLAAGTRIVWVVYPETLTIDVYEPDQEVVSLTSNQVLDGGSVLPDLKLSIAKIFERIQ